MIWRWRKYRYFFSYAVWKPGGIAFGNTSLVINFKIKSKDDIEQLHDFLKKRNRN